MKSRRGFFFFWMMLALPAAVGVGGEVPPGYAVEKVCDGITGGTGLAVLPDGRILVAEQTGTVRLVKDGKLAAAPVLTMEVESSWERGLMTVAVDPDFPKSPYLYVLSTPGKPYPHHRVSRFTMSGDTAGEEKVLFEGDNQNEMPGTTKNGHQGGGLAIGKDGKLYVGIGEQTSMLPAQELTSLLGKILRLNRDGSIPEDNPFYTKAQGKYRAIWALGMRNPWALAVQPGTGRVYANDVGASAWEEVDEIVAGGNYGWPAEEGKGSGSGKFKDPVFNYSHQMGLSLGGGCFFDRKSVAQPGAGMLPPELDGVYFFVDYMAGWMGFFAPENAGQVKMMARKLEKPVALAVAGDGSLLVLERNAWVKDGKFTEKTGWLTRIRRDAGAAAAAPVPPQPAGPVMAATLSALAKDRTWTPYEVVVPFWTPGWEVGRSLSLPAGKKLTVNAAGGFDFPAGTLLRHDMKRPGREVSMVFQMEAGGRYSAGIYEAGKDGDRTLLTQAKMEEGGGWFWPGPVAGQTLPVVALGWFIDLSPANLAGGGLAGLVEGGGKAARLVALEAKAPVADRVRAWLDVNCAACHQPGGPGRGFYDARFSTPLDQQRMINGPLMSGDLAVPGAKMLVPGHTEQSMLLIRLGRAPADPMRMPPGCLSRESPPVVPLLREWIAELGQAKK